MKKIFFYCIHLGCSRANCLYHQAFELRDYVEIESLPMTCRTEQTMEVYAVKVDHLDENCLDFPWPNQDGVFEWVKVHVLRKIRGPNNTHCPVLLASDKLRSIRGIWQPITLNGDEYYVSTDAELMNELQPNDNNQTITTKR